MNYLNRGNFMNWQVQWIKSSEPIHRKEFCSFILINII